MQIKDYNYFSKLLHKLVLGNRFILNSLFDLDNFIYRSKINLEQKRFNSHIYISGLARSGTTILLRSLYDTNKFASLTYNDMPFILSPNLWSKINNTSSSKNYKYASQNTKIKVKIESPEAFEEVFWKLFSGKKYNSKEFLNIIDHNEEVLKMYEKFINLILLRYDKDLYISKNNNNILRLDCIKEIFPNSIIIVPYRDPIQQSISLLNQHKYFLELNKKDYFSKKYTDYLGHYEFGENHKKFNLSEEFLRDYKYNNDPLSLNYWLVQWGKVYSHVLKSNEKKNIKILFLGYENLCSDPNYYLEYIFKKIGAKVMIKDKLILSKAANIEAVIEDEKLRNCIYSIYERLNNS